MSTPTSTDARFPFGPDVQPVWVENNPVHVSTAATAGKVAPAGSNAAATTAATDYTFAWTAATVNHIMLQNNSPQSVNWELDGPATPGSAALATGQTLFLDITASTLHLYTAAAQNVNGNASGNIVIRAWQ